MPRAKKIVNPAQDVLARFLALPLDAQTALVDTMRTVVAAQTPAVVKRVAPKPPAVKMTLPKAVAVAAPKPPATFAPENTAALRGPKRRERKLPVPTGAPDFSDRGADPVETIGENDQD